MKHKHKLNRNISIDFTANEIDIISEALTTVTGAPAAGVPALLKRFDDITGENSAKSIPISEEEIRSYEYIGLRTFRMRRYLNRKHYADTTTRRDTTADDWEDLLGGNQ